MKEFVVRVKEVYIVDVIISVEDNCGEPEAIREVMNGEGERTQDLEKIGYLHPRTWEVFEL